MKKINSTITTDVKLKKISFLKLQAELKYHKGFTLIELMVATAISIIVLLAASSAFITTFSLNQEVKQRINYDNDVQNTADLLRTDLREIGSFTGCYDTSELKFENTFPGLFKDNRQMISTNNISQKMKNMMETSLTVDPINNIKPLTVLHDSQIENGRISDSSYGCSTLIGNTGMGSVYLVGTTSSNKKPGLYRYVGVATYWQEPELLVSNVQDMSFTFYYDKHMVGDCPQTETEITPDLEKLTDIDTKYHLPPILVEVNLSICRSGKFKDNKCEEEVNNYVIQAMVRKGEFCI